MSKQDIVLKLLQVDRGARERILNMALDKYITILYNIANDIYDSCIEDFYAGYSPRRYTRHGNIEGFNLYRANEISFDGGYFNVKIDDEDLLPYGKKTDKSRVLNAVMNGKRGGSSIPGWPMKWYTSYPNRYSTQKIWQSSGRTIEDIFDDFIDNVLDDTNDIFWGIVEKYL